jgi:hypothetical protein
MSKTMDVSMKDTVTNLDELVVTRKKEKYSKKNNPAVDFVNKLRNISDSYNPMRMPYYSYDKYDKMIMGYYIDVNTTVEPALLPYMDYSIVSGQPYITLSIKEKVARNINRLHPKSNKEIVEGYQSYGIDEKINEESLRKVFAEILREVDIYNNDITIMQNRFVSPLSKIGPDFYKYYLTDTVLIDNEPCIELVFGPHNRETFGFAGRIYVPTKDSTMFVKKVVMQTPKAINLNYVRGLYIVQNFEKDSLGNRHKTYDRISVDFGILNKSSNLYAQRETKYTSFSYDPVLEYDKFYDTDGNTFMLPDATLKDDEYWQHARNIELTDGQSNMPTLMTELRKKKWFFWGEKMLSLLERGYLRTSPKSKFDIGPLNTIYSSNELEGSRFRLGGMTTANLSKRWFARAYGAYGLRDHKWKYYGELEYSFLDRKYHSREFPMNLIRLSYKYDVDQIGQHYLFTNADNIFLSLKRQKDNLMTYKRSAKLEYILEKRNGFSLEAELNYSRQYASKYLPFDLVNGGSLPYFNQSTVSLQLKYAPGDEFYQMASMRIPVNFDNPVISITQEFGPKGLLGSDFCYNKTEVSLMKRIWFSAFGYTDIIFRGAKIWSKVYYPALTWANANLSYTIQPESFSLLNPMEFATDQYLSLDFTYWGNGVLFNRIPFVKKAKLREVLTFKGYYGSLTDKNNPKLNGDLLAFPSDAHVGMMKKDPYMEMGVGIDNIFTVLRVDYVWRLTYRNTPGTDKSGLRLSVHVTF